MLYDPEELETPLSEFCEIEIDSDSQKTILCCHCQSPISKVFYSLCGCKYCRTCFYLLSGEE